MNGKDPRMSKLNFHVGRTVHFAHGYRNVGGREVGGKRVLVLYLFDFYSINFFSATENYLL